MNTPKKATGKKGAAAVEAVVKAETATATQAAATVVVAAKAPSKTSQAKPIFTAALAVRQAEIDNNVPVADRVYKTNKDFRLGVCGVISTTLGCSMASAGSMYNAFKIEAEAANPNVGLGRDPKKEKPAKKEKKVVVAAATPEAGTLNTSATDSVQTSQEEAGAQ